MPARKRRFEEVHEEDETTVAEVPRPTSMLHRVRNCWYFAALAQYIFFFGQAVKIDQNVDIDLLEEECLKPERSHILTEIGLALLKFVSSHRGLTPELFDEYTRRQYVAKAPTRNPFGEAEQPKHFDDFDIFTKLRVLHQLSTWTLNNPERIRERMEEKDNEQTQWRIEPLGWDRDDRSYFVLDDDRLYRRTDAPPERPPEPKAKKPKPKKSTAKGRRRSTRQQAVESPAGSDDEDEDLAKALEASKQDAQPTVAEAAPEEQEDDGLGGAKWECIAVTLTDYNEFLATIQKTRDPNEKAMHARITKDILPVLEKRVEVQERKAAGRRRELENLEKLATAKRSSRLADKHERQREIQAVEDAERKRREDLAMAQREQRRMDKLEEDRESRMVTREQRLRERETKRILHEEQLRRLRDDEGTPESSSGLGARTSERNRKVELERTQKALEQLQDDEEEWYFDCSVCGVHGKNLDDGTHSMACENCNVWQHSACHGVSEAEAESDEFHFVCNSCKKPKTSLKIRLGPSASPKEEKSTMNGYLPASDEVVPATEPSTATMVPMVAVPLYPSAPPHQFMHQFDGPASVKTELHYYPPKAQHSIPPAPASSPFKASPQANGTNHILPPQQPQYQYVPQHTFPNLQQQSPPPRPSGDPSHNAFSQTAHALSKSPAPYTSTQSSTSIQQTSNFPHTITNHNPHQSHPFSPFPQRPPPTLATSPTPSLAATEGNTAVRFSPSPKPAGSPRSSSWNTIIAPPSSNDAADNAGTVNGGQQQHNGMQQTQRSVSRGSSPLKTAPSPSQEAQYQHRPHHAPASQPYFSTSPQSAHLTTPLPRIPNTNYTNPSNPSIPTATLHPFSPNTQTQSHANTQTPAPTISPIQGFSTTPGLSPTKHAYPLPAPLNLSTITNANTQANAHPNFRTNTTTNTNTNNNIQSYDGTHDLALDPLSSPILSPSVNAGPLNLAPPVKRMSMGVDPVSFADGAEVVGEGEVGWVRGAEVVGGAEIVGEGLEGSGLELSRGKGIERGGVDGSATDGGELARM